MGKKNKNRSKGKEASTSSEPSSKRRKTSSQSPSPSPEPQSPPQIVDYQQMPLNHKKKFFINDDCGSRYKYIGLITWLRSMGTFAGSSFEGIENLNWVDGRGYPCVEIEVINPDGNSARFIISKSDLYLLAFYANKKWFQFPTSPYMFTHGQGQSFQLLDKKFTGRYLSTPWTTVGPKCMSDAVNFLATVVANGNMTDILQNTEVFYVHLCEAARFYPVESLICKTLAPASVHRIFDKPTYEDEEKTLLPTSHGSNVTTAQDVYSLVKATGPIDLEKSDPTPPYLKHIIKKFSNLSKAWYLYALSDKRCFVVRPEDVSRFHLRSIKSLRCTLAVLCNINLSRFLRDWDRKASANGEVTREVYQQMEERVRVLQRQAKVRVPTDDSQA